MNAGNPTGYCLTCSDSGRQFDAGSALNRAIDMNLDGGQKPEQNTSVGVRASVAEGKGITVLPIKEDSRSLLQNGALRNIAAEWLNRAGRYQSRATNNLISSRAIHSHMPGHIARRG